MSSAIQQHLSTSVAANDIHNNNTNNTVIQIIDDNSNSVNSGGNEQKVHTQPTEVDPDHIKFKVITWNLWCMIFAPRCLSNGLRCGKHVSQIAKQEDWKSFDGLIICGFQELWSWKTGLFPPFLLSWIAYIEYIPYLGWFISCIFQIITLLLGLLPILKCLPITYNPKKRIASKLKEFVPFSYYDITIPFRHVLDNGLLILSNHEADKHGSFGYVNHACDDSLAYKGYVYAYYKKFHCLVINTHLQSAGDGTARLAQVKELTTFIQKFKRYLKQEMVAMQHEDEDYKKYIDAELKIIAVGDFNIDMTNHDLLLKREQSELEMHRIQIEVDEHNDNEQEQDEHEKSVDVNSLPSVQSQELEYNVTAESQSPALSTVSTAELTDVELKCDGNDKLEEPPMSLAPLDETEIWKSSSYANLPGLLGSKFVKTNACTPSCKKEEWGSLDHILCNFDFIGFNEQVHGKKGKLSDHLMVKNEFTSSYSNLALLAASTPTNQ